MSFQSYLLSLLTIARIADTQNKKRTGKDSSWSNHFEKFFSATHRISVDTLRDSFSNFHQTFKSKYTMVILEGDDVHDSFFRSVETTVWGKRGPSVPLSSDPAISLPIGDIYKTADIVSHENMDNDYSTLPAQLLYYFYACMNEVEPNPVYAQNMELLKVYLVDLTTEPSSAPVGLSLESLFSSFAPSKDTMSKVTDVLNNGKAKNIFDTFVSTANHIKDQAAKDLNPGGDPLAIISSLAKTISESDTIKENINKLKKDITDLTAELAEGGVLPVATANKQ